MYASVVFGSLYDLLNQHFTRVEKQGEVLYFANVAVGTFSRPCLYHKDFQLLVHLPASATAPAPFYNRFEKTYVSMPSVWGDVLRDSSLPTETKQVP